MFTLHVNRTENPRARSRQLRPAIILVIHATKLNAGTEMRSVITAIRGILLLLAGRRPRNTRQTPNECTLMLNRVIQMCCSSYPLYVIESSPSSPSLSQSASTASLPTWKWTLERQCSSWANALTSLRGQRQQPLPFDSLKHVSVHTQ